MTYEKSLTCYKLIRVALAVLHCKQFNSQSFLFFGQLNNSFLFVHLRTFALIVYAHL